MKTIEINSLKELKKAAREFVEITRGRRQFAFYGPMGSGKTTLIKAICDVLGASSLVTSPTFSLVNEYNREHGEPVYHFDLYRINELSEMYDLGYEEYFYGNNYIFIEWAEKAETLLPNGITKVILEEITPGKRKVTIAI